MARTRALLQEALLSLILRKGYEAITVDEICEAANVGRSTFYSHYTGKDDLKRSGIDDHLRTLLLGRQRPGSEASADAVAHRFGFSLAIFEHARRHKALYRALAGGRGGTVALATIRQRVAESVRNDLAAAERAGGADDLPRDLVVEYVAGAYMALLTWWLDRGAKLPPERIDAIFRRLTIHGVAPPPP